MCSGSLVDLCQCSIEIDQLDEGEKMDQSQWLLLAVSILGLLALGGFFYTKKEGFGPHATSTLLLIVVLILSAMLYASGKLSAESVVNIFFAVIGFAGGLFTKEQTSSTSQSK